MNNAEVMQYLDSILTELPVVSWNRRSGSREVWAVGEVFKARVRTDLSWPTYLREERFDRYIASGGPIAQRITENWGDLPAELICAYRYGEELTVKDLQAILQQAAPDCAVYTSYLSKDTAVTVTSIEEHMMLPETLLAIPIYEWEKITGFTARSVRSRCSSRLIAPLQRPASRAKVKSFSWECVLAICKCTCMSTS